MGLELSGVIVTPVTPFTSTLEIDEDAVRELTGYFLSVKGINGIICNAHAGEGSALTPEERVRNIHIVREEVKGQVPVMSMVEAYGAAEAIRLINQAQDAERGGDHALPAAHLRLARAPKPGGGDRVLAGDL